MNKNQWFVFGIGAIIFSIYMFTMASSWGLCSLFEGELIVACVVRRYAFSIPAIIGQFLFWIFMICGFLEGKKKK